MHCRYVSGINDLRRHCRGFHAETKKLSASSERAGESRRLKAARFLATDRPLAPFEMVEVSRALAESLMKLRRRQPIRSEQGAGRLFQAQLPHPSLFFRLFKSRRSA